MDNNETQLNDSNVVFDEDGMKVLTKCKNCGGNFWVKQGKVFKKWFKGRCPVCGWTTIAKVGVRKIQTDENGEKIEAFKDEDKLIEYLNNKSIEDVDPMLCAAANMIRDLSDRHWSECWQIGVYSDTDEKARRLVAATTMEPLTVDSVKDSANAVKTIYTESDLDKLSPDDGTVRYYTD